MLISGDDQSDTRASLVQRCTDLAIAFVASDIGFEAIQACRVLRVIKIEIDLTTLPIIMDDLQTKLSPDLVHIEFPAIQHIEVLQQGHLQKGVLVSIPLVL